MLIVMIRQGSVNDKNLSSLSTSGTNLRLNDKGIIVSRGTRRQKNRRPTGRTENEGRELEEGIIFNYQVSLTASFED